MPTIGGQAVPGGVMMRDADRWAVAVRQPDGEIVCDTGVVPGWARRFEEIPIVRGTIALAAAMVVGVRGLRFAARHAWPVSVEVRPTRAIPVALGFAVALFLVVPALLASLVVADGGIVRHALETAIRLVLLLGYLWGVGQLAEIRSVFEYHGAEHAAVNAYEAGGPLTTASALASPVRHERCGTTFLLVVVVTASLLHIVVDPAHLGARLAVRAITAPLVAGMAYELLRMLSARSERRLARLLLGPAMALQRLTTRPPSADQVEVALVALRRVVGCPPNASPEAEVRGAAQRPAPALVTTGR